MSDIKIGDTVHPKGCSKEYQKQNPMVVRHIKIMRMQTIVDGEMADIRWLAASENGTSWFLCADLEKGGMK